MNNVLRSWGATPIGKIFAFGVLPGDLEKSVFDEAAQNGRKLIIAIREGMEYPEPEERAEIRESLKNLILENEDFFEQTTNTGRRKDRLIRNYCSECKRQLK